MIETNPVLLTLGRGCQSFAAGPKVGRGPFGSFLVPLRRIWSERKLRSGHGVLCAVGQEIGRCRPRLPTATG